MTLAETPWISLATTNTVRVVAKQKQRVETIASTRLPRNGACREALRSVIHPGNAVRQPLVVHHKVHRMSDLRAAIVIETPNTTKSSESQYCTINCQRTSQQKQRCGLPSSSETPDLSTMGNGRTATIFKGQPPPRSTFGVTRDYDTAELRKPSRLGT